jgi:ribonuclease P protein component
MIKLSFKFKKNYRIKKNIDFIFVFKNGSFIKDKFYTCKYIKSGLPHSRLGIVIRKQVGNSVKRNYEKRILREFFRFNKNNLTGIVDLIITVNDTNGTFTEKKASFERILSKIH